MKIMSDGEYKEVWDRFDALFHFWPSCSDGEEPFVFNMSYTAYKLTEYWNEEQEAIVNDIFMQMSPSDIYALDYQHDCFIFNPGEEIAAERKWPGWHDAERDCQVYFPSYYPDGDYHFFASKDFSYGMLGHPWKGVIYVFGNRLAELFERNRDSLGLDG